MSDPKLRCLLLLALLTVVGCSSDPGPSGVVDPTVVFSPEPGAVRLEAYESIAFTAKASDGSVLSPLWSVDDVEQGIYPNFQYLGVFPGNYALHAAVEWAGVLFEADWAIEVGETSSSITPAAQALVASSGERPGSIRLTWERPPAGQIEVPLSGFEIYIAEAPFGEADLDAMTPIFQAIDGQLIQQSHLFEGLVERAIYHLAVRVVDVLDRRSALSAVKSAESTGHFDLLGSVVRLEPVLPALKGPGVLIKLDQDHKTVTDQVGNFALLNVPDLLVAPLVIAEESGFGYYELHTLDNWPAVTQSINVTLFNRDVVLIDDGNPNGGFPEQVSTLEFLRYMTHNANRPQGTPHTVYRWDQYPVKVYAHPYSVGGVDYRLAFQRAVAAWNAATGEHLLELADAPVAVGVDYGTYSLAQMGSNSGETVQILPSGANLFYSIPEFMHIRLLDSFPTQARADLIVLHELGHVLMLNHSPSLDHVMVASAGSSSGELDRDEAFAARLISSIPQSFDLRWYRDPSGKTAVRLPVSPHSDWCGTGPIAFDRSGG